MGSDDTDPVRQAEEILEQEQASSLSLELERLKLDERIARARLRESQEAIRTAGEKFTPGCFSCRFCNCDLKLECDVGWVSNRYGRISPHAILVDLAGHIRYAAAKEWPCTIGLLCYGEECECCCVAANEAIYGPQVADEE